MQYKFPQTGGQGSDQGGNDDINGDDNDGNVCRCSLCTPCAGVNLTFPTVSNLFLWVVLVRLVGGCEPWWQLDLRTSFFMHEIKTCWFVPIWVFPKIMVPQNGWFIREIPIKKDDLGVHLFLETPICTLYKSGPHKFWFENQFQFETFSLVYPICTKTSLYHAFRGEMPCTLHGNGSKEWLSIKEYWPRKVGGSQGGSMWVEVRSTPHPGFQSTPGLLHF